MTLRHAISDARPAILPVVVLLIGACGGQHTAEVTRTPMPAGVPGAYSGTFPCGNCAGIDAALWLRDDGRFILRQRYVDDAGEVEDSSSYSLGHWHWDERTAGIVLRGVGPERKLGVTDAGGLMLETASMLPHELRRDLGILPLAESIPVTGIAVVNGTSATFRECISALELDVAAEGAFAELRRQHRAFSPRGRPALTAVAGYPRRVTVDGAVREVWVLDRVLNVKPNGSC